MYFIVNNLKLKEGNVMKKGTVLVAAMLLSGAMSIPVYAGTWVHEKTESNPKYTQEFWYYTDDNGNKVTDTWIEGSDKATWYYVGEDGYMVTYDYMDIGDSSYYCDTDGVVFECIVENPSDSRREKVTTAPIGVNAIYADENVAKEVVSTRKSPIEIFDIGTNINSADGASIYLCWRNGSGKTIKYISFDFIPYNFQHQPVYRNYNL